MLDQANSEADGNGFRGPAEDLRVNEDRCATEPDPRPRSFRLRIACDRVRIKLELLATEGLQRTRRRCYALDDAIIHQLVEMVRVAFRGTDRGPPLAETQTSCVRTSVLMSDSMSITTTARETTIWLVNDIPTRMIFNGRRWRVTDTPTRLRESVWSAPLDHSHGLYGWRFQATDPAGECVVFDVYRTEGDWHVHRSYA